MTARLKPHPAAELFPMMTAAELDELAADIRARGLDQPIVLHEGKILDGRNRYEACARVDVEPATVEWHSLPNTAVAASPVAWVLAANLHRRHLNESQRALIAAEALPLLEAEAAKRQKAGKKTLPGNWPAPTIINHESTDAPESSLPPRGGKANASKAKTRAPTSAATAAKGVGVSARSVERAKLVKSKRADLAQLIREGKQTLKQAEKAIRKEEQLKNVLEYRPPVGTYGVIVADVPWEYDDQLDGSDQARGGCPYPPMPLEEILAIRPPAAADCALWFWTTNAFLITGAAAQVVKAWGFEAKALYTWRKVDKKGNDRFGSGHYGRSCTEHVILAVRGKPVVDAGDQVNIFDAPRGRHSEKPARAFEVFEKVTPCAPEARIELFAIEERKGWVTSGSEQQAKARAQRSGPKTEASGQSAIVSAAWPLPGWEPSPGGWTKFFDGVGWCVDAPNGSRKWQAYRPKQGALRARASEDFSSAEEAAQWVESVAGGASELTSLPPVEQEPVKKKRKLMLEDVPPPPSPPRAEGIPFDAIAWTPKTHPSKVAVGVAPSGRRYHIEKHSKISPAGKKVTGYTFRWFGPNGASSLEDFSDVRDAQANAGHAEQQLKARV